MIPGIIMVASTKMIGTGAFRVGLSEVSELFFVVSVPVSSGEEVLESSVVDTVEEEVVLESSVVDTVEEEVVLESSVVDTVEEVDEVEVNVEVVGGVSSMIWIP
ncbi:MAG: hypothetical protein ACXAE3_00810 [Candidatus Kariarchaeaceae archaeon]|jgi:hypothetical protein